MVTMGIDLGTSYCRAAFWENGRVNLIQDCLNKRKFPSLVSFTREEQVIGRDAIVQLERNAANTVYGIKRLIGRSYNEIKNSSRKLPFNVRCSHENTLIKVKYKEQELELLPEEITAMVLRQMKETAESYTERKIIGAVISVPGTFSDRQRLATIDAARIAGIDLVGLINESTAAAIAYGIENEEPQKICVIHLGGGYFDVSVIEMKSRRFTVLATCGDRSLGGDDFTMSMVEHFAKEFENTHQYDLREKPGSIGRLRVECEKTKRALSLISRAGKDKRCQIAIPAIVSGKDIKSSITREQFEEINRKSFRKIHAIIKKTLDEAGASPEEVNKVLPIGSSTRMPKIRETLEKYFGAHKICGMVNAEEAVAIGTAEYAAFFADNRYSNPLTITDVANACISFQILLTSQISQGEHFDCIRRNENIPVKKRRVFPGGQNVQVQERREEQDVNNKLFTFKVQPKLGDVAFQVQVDIDGIFHIRTIDKKEDEITGFRIGLMALSCADEKIEEAEKRNNDDKLWRERVKAMDGLESSAYELRKIIRKSKHPDKDKREANSYCKDVLEWINNNRDNITKDTVSKQKKYEEELQKRRTRFLNPPLPTTDPSNTRLRKDQGSLEPLPSRMRPQYQQHASSKMQGRGDDADYEPEEIRSSCIPRWFRRRACWRSSNETYNEERA